ncbi:mucin-2-like isoform X2 [Eurosta solidaginis]|uniref:mucin-2-like isoform X2 n=1 Tax=Eurosta solidaginis TaxID=178769 RepID=UPI0035313BBC
MIKTPTSFLNMTENNVALSKPLIGVLCMDRKDGMSTQKFCYIDDKYVEYLEVGGAEVVPIWINKDLEYYEYILNRVNGVLIPGGAVFVNEHDPARLELTNYCVSATYTIIKIAIRKNEQNVYLPIWGTCLGMQLLVLYTTAMRYTEYGTDPRESCEYMNCYLPVKFLPDFRESRMFRNFPAEIEVAMRNEPFGPHRHKYCVSIEPSCPKDEWSLPTTVSVTTDSTSTKQTATTTAPTSKETTIIFQQTTTPEATTNSLPTIIVIEPTIITPEMTVPTLDITTPTPELSASDPTKSISAPTTTVLITDASLLTSTTYLTTTTKSETSEQSAADTNIPTTPLVSTTKAEPTRTLETTTIPTTTATPLITTPAATTELITTSTVTITVLPTILTTSGSTETQTITSQNSLTTTFQTTTTFSPTTATVQHLTPLEICEQNSIEARTSFFGLPGDVTCKNYIMCLQIGSYWSAVQRSCTTNKWFDLVLGKCSESYNCPSTNVSVTGTTQTATTQPTTTTVLPKTTKQLTTTMQDISTPLEVCEQNALERQTAFFDSPGDTTCKKYIVCTKVGSSWKVQERKCSSNKWFDPVAAKCSESYRCFSTIQL